MDWDRYAYVRNNPVNNTDPTGHCIWDLCIVESTVIVELTVLAVLTVSTVIWYSNPEVREAGVESIADTLDMVENGINQAAETITAFAKSAEPKPLTPDEKKKVDHLLDDLDGFLDNHPDVGSEAEKEANGEELVYDHVKEVKEYAQGVNNDIAHLERVWKNRTEEAQKDIERAIDTGNKWLKRVNEILKGRNAQ